MDIERFKARLRRCRGQITAVIACRTDPGTVFVLEGNRPLELRWHPRRAETFRLRHPEARFLEPRPFLPGRPDRGGRRGPRPPLRDILWNPGPAGSGGRHPRCRDHQSARRHGHTGVRRGSHVQSRANPRPAPEEGDRRVLVPVQVNGTVLPTWLYVVGDRWTGSFKELTGGIWR